MKKRILSTVVLFVLILSGCGSGDNMKQGYYDEMRWTSSKNDVEKYLTEKFGDDGYKTMASSYVVNYDSMPGFDGIEGFEDYAFIYDDDDDLLDCINIVYMIDGNEEKKDMLFEYLDKKFTDLYGETDDVHELDSWYEKKWNTKNSIISYDYSGNSVHVTFSSHKYEDYYK